MAHARLVALVLAQVITIGPLVAQEPPRQTRDAAAPAAVASAQLAGAVTRLDTGAPVRRARLTLASSGTRQRFVVTSDTEGRFRFDAIPAGTYTLAATRPGLLDATFGQEQPGSGRPGTSIEIREGQRMEGIDVRMAPGGVITGLVIDEGGEPVYGATVRALRRVFRDGTVGLLTGASVQTDDRGQYRLPLLVPGDYVVMVEWLESGRHADEALEVAARVAEMAAAAARSGSAAMAAELKAMNEQRQALAEAEAPDGYAATYYPGTPIGSMARAIGVTAGSETGGIDVRLDRVPLAGISGVVTGVLSDNTVTRTLYLIDHQQAPGLGRRRVPVTADGSFSVSGLPPGRYGLAFIAAPRQVGLPAGASRSMAEGFSVGAAFGGRGGAAAEVPPTLWGATDVTLAGRSIGDVVISVQPGVAISGTVTFDGAPPATRGPIAISLVPTGSPDDIEALPPTRPAVVDDTGAFTLRGVVPGQYRLTTALGLPGFGAKSAMVAGVDALDVPIDVRPGEDVTGVALTMTTRMAELSGMVRTADATPHTGVTIVLFADDSRYWLPQARRIAAGRPSTEGRFRFTGLAPGRYRLAAVTDPEPGQWYDPDFLRSLVPGSIAIELSEGAQFVQDLQVGR